MILAGDLHAVNVVLLSVGACQEELLGWCNLVWSEDVHAWSLSVEGLADFDNGMPGVLQALG